jgi:flagellar biosynthesis GTPase FlhF
MSDGDNGDNDDPFTDAAVTDPPDEEALREERRALDQRERGLSDFADELDEREAELDERAKELRRERKELDERNAELDSRENRIAEREAELDDRETAIAERERELDERAAELDEKEETLQEYVNDAVRETVREAVAEAAGNDGKGRFGRIGSLVLALVGVTLIVGGVLNGFAASIPSVPVVFGSETANLAVTVLLLFSGLSANLAAVAD